MSPWLHDHAGFLSALLAVSAYFFIAITETLAPQQPAGPGQGRRWVRSASIHAVGLLATGACIPIAASTVVDWGNTHGLGLFNHLHLPTALMAFAGVVLLDLGTYLTHRSMHRVPWLWRFHQVHHSDLHFDCATDLLHHPVEMLVVGILFLAQVLLWGLPQEAVLAFALLSVLSGPWQHGNLRLPTKLQRMLEPVLVTPEMHRIHHSTNAVDGNRNFSVIFPWWDKCFGSHARQPQYGWTALRFGLAERQSPDDVTFHALLFRPCRTYG